MRITCDNPDHNDLEGAWLKLQAAEAEVKRLTELKVGIPRLLEAMASSPGADERDALVGEIKRFGLQLDAARKAIVALFSSFVEVCKTSTGTFTEFQRNAVALAKPFLDCPRHGYYAKYQIEEAPCSCPITQANETPKTGQENQNH